MGVLWQRLAARGRATMCCAAGVVCVAVCGATVPTRPSSDAWQNALNARQVFEAEASGTHTKAEYAGVMDGFRAIYHGNPGDPHSARAVEQVAELLAEEGHELNDRKALRDAAGQYEFLAKAYPGGTLAAAALGHAYELLGPQAANDAVEAQNVASQLQQQYPRSAVTRALVNKPKPIDAPQKSVAEAPVPRHPDSAAAVEPVSSPVAAPHLAMVTGIRHWSTSTYTRVAIDLGDEVEYQAARVENPDRIFFDLHHARLASGLAGKSFTITDDGFLTRIRAAQFSNDVTRVVLDVNEVGEYSAFLLPNPYRLIIDIHGKAGSATSAAKSDDVANNSQPVVEQPIATAPSRAADTEPSSLPPMPVTDGSERFGLPAAKSVSSAKVAVPAPRVVISTVATPSKPVPNTISSRAENTGAEVADVSQQPGKVEATRRPTSQPIVERTARVQGPGPRVPVPDPYAGARTTAHVAGAPVEPPPPTAEGQTSLVRALGLKIGRIVIDAGHGGHDSGTLGVGGIEEKDVVLDVALRLGKLLHDRLGAEIVYTRADDTFIPLETRTAIANKAQADLFISVHANSSQDATARGVEVYYLNFTSDPVAMQVASRENAVSTQSVHELSDLVKKITLKDKIDESRELASDVDDALFAGIAKGNGALKNRGVKKAPFVVLIGANMPSILAEISFVTNPQDAAELARPDYRQRVAESLYNGVAKYDAGINGAKPVAPKTERAAR